MSGERTGEKSGVLAVCCTGFAVLQACCVSRSLYAVLPAAGATEKETGLSAVLFPALLCGALLWCIKNWLFGMEEECHRERMTALVMIGALTAVCAAAVLMGSVPAAAGNHEAAGGLVPQGGLAALSVRCDEKKRFVELKIGGDQKKCLIEIVNSVSGSVLQDGKLPRTTKEDAQNHGLGYANVEAIVKRYNGSIRMEERNDSFGIAILLFRKMAGAAREPASASER